MTEIIDFVCPNCGNDDEYSHITPDLVRCRECGEVFDTDDFEEEE